MKSMRVYSGAPEDVLQDVLRDCLSPEGVREIARQLDPDARVLTPGHATWRKELRWFKALLRDLLCETK